MFDWLGGLFGGVSNVISSAFQNQQSWERQQEANLFNAQQAQLNRDWSSREAGVTRDFNAQQAGITRDFASTEAAKAREFNSAEAVASYERSRDASERAFNQASVLQSAGAQFSANEAEKNRQFQQMMSSTSYQRAMQDMRAAGLNPILAYAQGGASTPAGSAASIGGGSGSMASSSAASGPAASAGGASSSTPGGTSTAAAHAANVAPLMTPGVVSSALAAAKSISEIKILDEEARARKEVADANRFLPKIKENENTLLAQNIEIARNQVHKTAAEASAAKTDKEFYESDVGRIMRTAGTGGQEAGKVASTAKDVIQMFTPRAYGWRGQAYERPW